MREIRKYRVVALLMVLLASVCGQSLAAGMHQEQRKMAMSVPEDTVVVKPVSMDSVPDIQPAEVEEVKRLPHSRMRRERGKVSENAGVAVDRDSVMAASDSATESYADSLQRSMGDTLALARFNEWKPDPIRAMWLGMVFPGGGQIYNRKYWKLPFVYGGVLGCVYAVSWNGQMLRDYSQAYQDISDNDPTTNSYLEMLPLGYDITGREDHFKSVFKRKKNFYRRYRDLSIFCIAGVYLLSIIDAYVDAELSTFDIGHDLSLNIAPTSMTSGMLSGNSIYGSSPGITFQLKY